MSTPPGYPPKPGQPAEPPLTPCAVPEEAPVDFSLPGDDEPNEGEEPE